MQAGQRWDPRVATPAFIGGVGCRSAVLCVVGVCSVMEVERLAARQRREINVLDAVIGQ